MSEHTIRAYRSMADAEPQYRLWLSATEGLTRPWRSCLRNVQHQLANAEKHAGCRLYAEDAGGKMVGYIGTHPPFEWDPAAHGPPSDRLGWAIPFGLPWTHPRDPALEATLYDEMIRTTPETYAAFQRDIYIQRFRESWTDRLRFLTDRGWKLFKRLPLLGRGTVGATSASPLRAVKLDDAELLAELSERDPTAESRSAEAFRAACEGGWLALEECWRVGDHGVFALEPRGRWAAVTAMLATPEHWDQTLNAAASRAAALGAGEIYFTIDENDRTRHHALAERGFAEVDAGVYYLRDAD